MSKYDALWEYVQKNGSPSFKLTFEEIAHIAGIPIDHAFLTYKKRAYGIWVSGRKNIYERSNSVISEA